MVTALRRRSGHWAVAAFAVAVMAVPIGFHFASPSFTLKPPREGYPIRFELPRAQPAVEFDISDFGAAGDGGGSAVEIRKAVRLNGADAGSATIRVSAGSTLSISADELRRVLLRAGRGDIAGQVGGPAGAGHFVDFEEMRRQGIDVRYDASADRILIAA